MTLKYYGKTLVKQRKFLVTYYKGNVVSLFPWSRLIKDQGDDIWNQTPFNARAKLPEAVLYTVEQINEEVSKLTHLTSIYILYYVCFF